MSDILFRGGLSQPTRQQPWLEWLRPLLPPELAPHLVQVLARTDAAPDSGELVAFADSPAWCARLRYALLGLEDRIRARDPTLRRARARVLMRGVID